MAYEKKMLSQNEWAQSIADFTDFLPVLSKFNE